MSVYLDYAQRGRNAWWRYLLVMALGVVLTLLVVPAIAVPLIWAGVIHIDDVRNMLNPVHPVSFFLGNGVAFLGMVASFSGLAWLLQNKRPLDIVGEWRWTRFGAGLALWAACLVAAALVDFALKPSGFHWTATAQTPTLAVSALFGLGVQAFAEEYVFRGYLTQGLLLAFRQRQIPTAIVSGLIFGSVHIPNGWPQAANAVLFGVLTALIAIRTGGIAFTYGLHLVNNLFGAVVVVSADDVFKGAPGLFTQHTPGLLWWDVFTGVVLLAIPAWLVLRRPAGAQGAG